MANCKVIAVTNQKGRRGQNHDHSQPRHRACPASKQDSPIPDGCGILHHSEGVDLLPANIELSA